jgi:uncharacterized protein YbaP (TraB family)
MVRKFAIIACILPILAGCSALKNENARKHILWKVSDSNSCVYLLGSVHFADSSFYPLDSAITVAFEHSDELGVELDMGDTAVIQKIIELSAQRGLLPEGESLDRILPADVQNSLDSLCMAWYIPLGTFNRYKPWAAAMTLSSVAIGRKGLNPIYGIDVYFLRAASERGMPILSLETVEDQVNALTGEGTLDSLSIYYVKSTLRDMPLLDSSITMMVRAWKTGDVAMFRGAMELESQPEDAMDSLLSEELNERIYTSRNRKMAEKVEGLLASDRKVFIVVGAAHLVGKDENVIDLLRAKGFTVEQK